MVPRQTESFLNFVNQMLMVIQNIGQKIRLIMPEIY